MMRPLHIVFFLLAVLLPAGCGDSAPTQDPTSAADTLYTCSMHPNVVQPEPGQCPICGMDLTPMRSSSSSTSTDVVIDPAIAQQVGVQVEPVHRQPVFRHLRTIGQVEVGEDELAVVNLRYSGWVEKLYVDKTGDPVTKGQVLFDIYSPELVNAQEEYLLALRTQGADSPLARSSRRKLELWNLGERDIASIVTAGEARRALPVRAPQSGFVLHKDLVEGGRVSAGQDVYRIGNLRRIWVTAEIYEHDAPWVEVDQPAQMELSYQPGEVLEGKVSYIYPTLDAKSRTLTVRLEFENRGIRLKPGMFATVYIEYRRKNDVIAVPSEAILHTGRRSLVFVSTGDGHYAPREVTTGLVGDRHMTEVLSGLNEGDLAVVSGQFLIDSESQLQEALRKMVGPDPAADHSDHAHHTEVFSCPMHPEVLSAEAGRCPECGMDLESRAGAPEELEEVFGVRTAHAGEYTCPMHPEVISDKPGRCPECGMFLELVGPEASK